MELTPEQLKRVYKSALQLSYSVIILGPPGVGKTASIHDFAYELAKKEKIPLLEPSDFETLSEFNQKCPNGNCVLFVYLNLNTILPIDIGGVPEKIREDERTAVAWIPLVTWLACKQSRYCVIVLDEFNTVENPDVMAMAMRLMSEHRAGNIKIHTNKNKVLVVALGNPPQFSSIAKPLPAPLLGGKALVVHAKPPTIQQWIEWMVRRHGSAWHRPIAGAIAAFPEIFVKVPESEETLEPYPTPRGWTKAARLCYFDPERCEMYIQALCGNEAVSVYQQYKNMVVDDLEDILRMKPEERVLKLIIWATKKYCDANEKQFKLLADRATADELAVITYITSGLCPSKNNQLYKLLPDEKRKTVFSDRYTMRETEIKGENPLGDVI